MGQMCWRSVSGKDGEKVLHIRRNPDEFWAPYTEFPNLMEPDTVLTGLRPSKGFRTAQKLLKMGYAYVSSEEVEVIDEHDRRFNPDQLVYEHQAGNSTVEQGSST